MITEISTEYLTYASYGQPTSVKVQLTFINITAAEKELIRKLQAEVLQGIEPKMSEE